MASDLADAIERGNLSDLQDELGDLLLQVVFHAQMADEQDAFAIDDVVASINTKMIRRHPHVFADDASPRSADEQTQAWEVMKAEERAANEGDENKDTSALAGVALALPSLLRAEKLQKRAARTGFDWTEPAQIFEKLDEEIGEVKEAIADDDKDAIEDEIGDLLFVCANLARRLNIDPEAALKRANSKFETRFRSMERLAESRDQRFEDLTLEQQEALWQDVKRG